MRRRDFYEKIILLLGGIISAGLALPAAAYLLLPGRKRDARGWADVGPVRALPEGEPTRLEFRRRKVDAWRKTVTDATAWILRDGEEVIAYGPSCPHLGCGYKWDGESQKFVCPCHDSYFRKNGEVISGPAGRPLDRYRTRVENGRLFLGEIHRMDEEES